MKINWFLFLTFIVAFIPGFAHLYLNLQPLDDFAYSNAIQALLINEHGRLGVPSDVDTSKSYILAHVKDYEHRFIPGYIMYTMGLIALNNGDYALLTSLPLSLFLTVIYSYLLMKVSVRYSRHISVFILIFVGILVSTLANTLTPFYYLSLGFAQLLGLSYIMLVIVWRNASIKNGLLMYLLLYITTISHYTAETLGALMPIAMLIAVKLLSAYSGSNYRRVPHTYLLVVPFLVFMLIEFILYRETLLKYFLVARSITPEDFFYRSIDYLLGTSLHPEHYGLVDPYADIPIIGYSKFLARYLRIAYLLISIYLLVGIRTMVRRSIDNYYLAFAITIILILMSIVEIIAYGVVGYGIMQRVFTYTVTMYMYLTLFAAFSLARKSQRKTIKMLYVFLSLIAFFILILNILATTFYAISLSNDYSNYRGRIAEISELFSTNYCSELRILADHKTTATITYEIVKNLGYMNQRITTFLSAEDIPLNCSGDPCYVILPNAKALPGGWVGYIPITQVSEAVNTSLNDIIYTSTFNSIIRMTR